MATNPKKCLQCKHFMTCSDPSKKTLNYSCDRFKQVKNRAQSLNLTALLPDSVEADNQLLHNAALEYDDDFDVVGLIESSYDEDTQTVRDLKIDDRDLKKAQNYFDFCSNFVSKGTRMPFARQMWLGLTLFGERCPKCSNPKWANINNVPVDFPAKDIQEHVQLLVNGKCPKCKGTKSGFVNSGKMNLYTELDVCAGQRGGKCLRGDTEVVTSTGIRTLKELWESSQADVDLDGFKPLTEDVFVFTDKGRYQRATHAYKTRGQMLRITFDDGTVIEGLGEHKIWILNDRHQLEFKKLSDLVVGDATLTQALP